MTRDEEVLELCKKVLSISPEQWDNPNGPYTTTCPFCGVKKYGRGHKGFFPDMEDLKHEPNCAYNIAKGLSTNLLKGGTI